MAAERQTQLKLGPYYVISSNVRDTQLRASPTVQALRMCPLRPWILIVILHVSWADFRVMRPAPSTCYMGGGTTKIWDDGMELPGIDVPY